MSLFEFCIRRPGLRDGAEPGPGAARHRVLRPADGARISQRRRAGGVGLDQLSRRLGDHHREPDHAGAGGLDRRHRGHRRAGIDQPRRDAAASPSASVSDVDPDVAASDVRDRVSRVRRRLPDEVEEPTIAKVEADAQAIMYLVFTSDRMTALEITDYVDRFVVDRLKNLTGVADVTIFGERRYAMRIWIDRERLAAFNLTVQDVENALQRAERRAPVRAHREPRPRVHRAVAHRPGDARAVPQHRRQDRRRPSGQARRGGARRARRRGRAARQPLQRRAGHRRRHHQAGGRQSARRVEGRARGAAGDQPVAAARPVGRHRQRQRRVHRPLDQGRLPHHRRGDRAGRAGDLLLPAIVARLADPDRHHSDLADRHLHAAVRHGLHASTR